ncbi:MAG: OsmC family protein [Polyangiaceae bacterium]|nr:OsmC family protein [Polyangiaceae bacterium]
MSEFSIKIEQVDGFDFKVQFDKEQYKDLHLDEPYPLGKDSAPNAARVLAAAIGNCLSASLVFCLQRSGVKTQGMTSEVKVQIVRNENKRLRIGKVDVTLHPKVAKDAEAMVKCLPMFEDFCTVTASIRQGIEVDVHVTPENTAA